MREVGHVGFIITREGIKPGSQKIRAVTEFPRPENVHEIRRFLGLTGYFRRFIPNYAIIARPLTEMLKNDRKFEFEDSCQNAFDELKTKLCKPPVLASYNPDAPTELHTDASSHGIAGMLMQRDESQKLRLVYCVSKKTTDCERMYHSSKLELLAIVWSIERLRGLLIGKPFKVVTDCQALVYLNLHKSVKPQIARWASVLQEYDFTIEHRSGQNMSHVDALSRAPVEAPTDTDDTIIEQKLTVLTTCDENTQITMMQRSDEKLSRFIDILKQTNKTREQKNLIKDLILREEKLYIRKTIRGRERLLFVIPDTMRKSIVVKCHDLSGHFSVDRTIDKILERYWLARMKRYVRLHIRSCLDCLFSKSPAGRQAGELHPIPPPERPFERIHLDHLGPFITSSKGNMYLLVIIDAFSRFCTLYAVRNTKSTVVIRSCDDYIYTYGVPNHAVTDRGTCFTATRFEDYCNTRGIRHTLNSPRHPQANGMVERVNRTLLPLLQIEMKNEKQWDVNLKRIQFHLNAGTNKTTGRTPFEIIFGFTPRMDNARWTELIPTSWEPPEEHFEAVRERILTEQAKYKKYYDKSRCKNIQFDVGEIVVVRAPLVATGESTKLQTRYKGPFTITKDLGQDTYVITPLTPSKGRCAATTAHVSQLKPYRPHLEEQLIDETDDSDTDKGEPETPIPNERDGIEDSVQNDRVVNPVTPAIPATAKRSRRPPKYLDSYICNRE